jgi:outer membrane immunogenic protein
MKSRILSSALLVGWASCAGAADLPVYKATTPVAPYVVPAVSWTGFYVGGHAGYGWAANGGVAVDPSNAAASTFLNTLGTPGSLDASAKGIVGGGQFGYNQQFGAFVLGVEALVDATNMSSSASQLASAMVGKTMTQAALMSGTRIDWDDALMLRAGYLVTPNILVAAVGGLAFGNISDDAAVACIVSCKLNGFSNGPSNIHTGWTLGAEIDYMVTSNIIAGLRYRYVDLGTQSFLVSAGGAVPATFNASDSARWNEATFKIDFKF